MRDGLVKKEWSGKGKENIPERQETKGSVGMYTVTVSDRRREEENMMHEYGYIKIKEKDQ